MMLAAFQARQTVRPGDRLYAGHAWLARADLRGRIRPVSETGVLGDVRGANAGAGEAIFAAMADELAGCFQPGRPYLNRNSRVKERCRLRQGARRPELVSNCSAVTNLAPRSASDQDALEHGDRPPQPIVSGWNMSIVTAPGSWSALWANSSARSARHPSGFAAPQAVSACRSR